MRLVQLETDAVSKGYPLGDGIGLFGVGSSALENSGGGRAGGGKPESSMELHRSTRGSKSNLSAAGSSAK